MLDKLKHSEVIPVIRMTLFMDKDHNGVLRVERCMSDTPPDNYFKGERFTHSAFPNALAFRGENGFGRVIWGFGDSVKTSWNRYHGACGRLKGACQTVDGTLNIHGWGDIGVFNNRPPIRLCCDFPDAQQGEASVFIGGGGGIHGEYARAWFFTRYDGPNSYTIGCNPTYLEVEYDGNVKSFRVKEERLDKPYERPFKFVTKFDGADLGAAISESGGMNRITRFDLSGRVICWTGMNLTTKDNRLAIGKVTEKCAAWRVGLRDGDTIERINGKQYTEVEAKELLKGAIFGTEYVLDIDRNGERKTYTVHAE